jgi:hypothetical protein
MRRVRKVVFLPSNTFLGRLRMVEVWDYYDGPRLFVAQNAASALFVALWADQTDDIDTWLYVPVSEARLELIHAGRISLRDAYLRAEDGQVFECTVKRGIELLQLRPVEAVALNSEWLPPEDDRLAINGVTVPAPMLAPHAGLSVHWLRIVSTVRTRQVPATAVSDLLGIWCDLFRNLMHRLEIDGDLIPLGTAEGSFRVALGIADPRVTEQVLSGISRALSLPSGASVDAIEGIEVDLRTLSLLLAALSEHRVRLEITVESDSETTVLSPAAALDQQRIIAQYSQIQRLGTDLIPQADDLARAFRVVELTASHREVTPDSLDVVSRQVSYYKHACRVLGYLNEENALTLAGKQLVGLEAQDRIRTTVVQFERSECGYAWIKWSDGRTLRDVRADSAQDFLTQRSELSESTVRRRAQTLRAWHHTLVPLHYGLF